MIRVRLFEALTGSRGRDPGPGAGSAAATVWTAGVTVQQN